MMLDVAILTDDKLLHPDPNSGYVTQAIAEDNFLVDGLRAQGVTAERVCWDDQNINWSQVGTIVFRSTWDYQDKLDQFNTWLDDVKTKTKLLNSYETIRWNLNKRYLQDLERQNISVVPTVFLDIGDAAKLQDVYQEIGAEEIVVKPTISAGGVDTYRIAAADIDGFEARFQELLSQKPLMIQPFQADILESGELSLMVMNGQFTHAVRKNAKAGEFRVQDDHGGTVVEHQATEEEKHFAENAVKACPEMPYYARVDVVYNAEGKLAIMELELFEPELFFRYAPEAAEKLVQSIISA